jgi:hypothetical protein
MSGNARTYYIKHIQRITFDTPVFCEPTLIRLHPRSDAHGLVRSTRLDVTPRPAGIERSLDLSGNFVWRVWFSELTMSLSVAVTSCVERFPQSSHSLRAGGYVGGRGGMEDVVLSNCFARAEDERPELTELIQQVFERCEGTPRAVLRQLATAFADRFAPPGRGQAVAPPPSGADVPHATATGQWAEWLADAGRLMNIPARIVRGYNALTADEIDHEMAVWTEFYLAGWGWCGFDPLSGAEVDQHYVPVSHGRTLAAAPTVSGDYRGSSRRPETSTQIILRESARPHVDAALPVSSCM